MGACKTKIKKNTINQGKLSNQHNFTLQKEFNATEETGKKRQGLLQLDVEKCLNSPSSGGFLLSNRSITKTKDKKGTILQINSPQKVQDQIINSNASKKYSYIQKRLANDKIKILQNNKTGIIVEMETLSKEESSSTEYVQWLLNADLDHNNIKKLLEIYQDQNQYQVIFEHFDGKDLFELISESDEKMPKKQMAQITEQMLRAMDYIHNLNKTHGHLSLHSFRVKKIKDDFIVKLVDLSKLIIKDPDEEDIQGLKFISPECALHPSHYTKSRDVWSIGLLAYTLRKRKLLYEFPPSSQTTYAQIQKIMHTYPLIFDNKKDQIYKQFLISILSKNSKIRNTCSELLQHPFILQNQKPKVIPQIKLLQNLLNSKGCCLLQELILGYLLQEFNWDEYILIQKLFLEGDQDMDGLLNKQELLNLYKTYVKDQEEDNLKHQIDELFILFELNDKGGINNQHFQAMTVNRKTLLTKHNIEICFSIFANDKTEITLRGIRRHLNYEDQDLIDEFAKITDNENKLSMTQFEKLVKLLL